MQEKRTSIKALRKGQAKAQTARKKIIGDKIRKPSNHVEFYKTQ